MGSGRSEIKASINNNDRLTDCLSSLGGRVWLLSDSNASSSFRQWLTPRSHVLSNANTIIGSFDSNTAQIRDMRMNRLILFSSPDLKFVLHPESKRKTMVFAYLPGVIDLHKKQKHLYVPF
jgi:hypothetical protein